MTTARLAGTRTRGTAHSLTATRQDRREAPRRLTAGEQLAFATTADVVKLASADVPRVSLRGLEPAAFSRTIQLPFKGTTMRVIGREDFIAMRAFAGGPQDIADARNAILLSSDALDVSLLRARKALWA